MVVYTHLANVANLDDQIITFQARISRVMSNNDLVHHLVFSRTGSKKHKREESKVIYSSTSTRQTRFCSLKSDKARFVAWGD